jgi:cysteinyl-tRNA synthetase
MALRLYNTLTRTKEEFRPLDPSRVRMYVCGPTVYDFAHIGNARPIIVFDLLFRLLRHLYGKDAVTYVRNVTDVDDKINARAAERGVPIRDLTDGTLRQFHEDIRALGVLMPEDVNEPGKPPRFIEPRATDHIEEMKALIERLLASGHAYLAEEHVLFDVPSMPDYGALSKRPLDEMEAGARVDVAPYKRSPLDFVLWKPSKAGEPSWPSPAGIATPGRPGWHIECSAMAWKHLGETFDIHAGGIDLVFPHHENEVAQTRCGFGTRVMANYWLHNGFLQVEGEKMAKSAGNFVTIRELLGTDTFGGSEWDGEELQLAMLKTHYRQPIDWTVAALKETRAVLRKWQASRRTIHDSEVTGEPTQELVDILADDLNTPAVLTYLHELDKAAGRARRDAVALANSLYFLGIEAGIPPAETLVAQQQGERIRLLIAHRSAARAAKNWAESDRIRDELAAMGIALKDNKDGTTTWEVAR